MTLKERIEAAIARAEHYDPGAVDLHAVLRDCARAIERLERENVARQLLFNEVEKARGEALNQCDEWKAKAEAAECENAVLSANCDPKFPCGACARCCDAVAASAERMREVLADAPVALAPDPEWTLRVEAALSEPVAPWLRERDRALAMKVAQSLLDELDRRLAMTGAGSLGDFDLAAIVAEVVP